MRQALIATRWWCLCLCICAPMTAATMPKASGKFDFDKAPPARSSATTQKTSPTTRTTLPSESEQQEKMEMVRRVLAEDYLAAANSPTASAELAKKLRKRAEAVADPAEKLAILREARRMYFLAGEPGAAMELGDEIAANYDIDAMGWNIDVLREASKRSDLHRRVYVLTPEMGRVLIDRAIQREDSEAIRELGRVLPALVSKAPGKATSASLAPALIHAKWAQGVLQSATTQKVESAGQQVLTSQGLYWCAIKGDWAKGLPLLAECADGKLKSAALKELAAKDEKSKAAAADEWWSLGAGRKELPKAIQNHAVELYRASLPKLDGLVKELAEKRIEQASLDAASTAILSPELLPFMTPTPGSEVTRTEEGVRIARGGIRTPTGYAVPCRIDVIAKTNSTNIRLGFGEKGLVIFNWENNQDELRVHDPLKGSQMAIGGKGKVPANQFVHISWQIEPNRVRIVVDGEERANIVGDRKGVTGVAEIFQAIDSVVTVQSFKVTEQ